MGAPDPAVTGDRIHAFAHGATFGAVSAVAALGTRESAVPRGYRPIKNPAAAWRAGLKSVRRPVAYFFAKITLAYWALWFDAALR